MLDYDMDIAPARAWRRFPFGVVACLLVLGGPVGVASAQTLAEVTLVAAISAELNPLIRLPRGSMRAVGSGTAPLIAKVPDAPVWSSWEVYTAGGIAMGLRGAFVRDVANNFALAGYFESERSERQVGDETHTRYVFTDGAGDALLYVVQSPQELIWMIARSD